MAEILSSLVKPAKEEVGRITVAAIKRQFSYLCCFSSNIQSLSDEANKLGDAVGGLQAQVNTAKNNGQEILPEVETWLTDAANITQVKNEIPRERRGFMNIKSRYSTSRKAKKTTEAMKKLVDSCNFNPISQPPPPASMVSLPMGTTPMYEFQSRKQMEEDIMKALRAKKINILGICGMGLGKTTMAKTIVSRVRDDEHLFDEVVMTVVSQPVNMFEVQQKIGELLGIHEWRAQTLEGRKTQLRARLMGNKRILMLLDDVWERLKLEELGIPCQNDLHEVQILSEQEAWHLFREKVGTCVDDFDMLSIAKQVMQECEGLPLALTTVGMTLKNENDKGIWEDALQQLKSSNPVDMHYVVPNLYHHIKLSYDFLDNQHARSLFLLCSLFPEDYDIHLDYLTCIWITRLPVEIGSLNRLKLLEVSACEKLKRIAPGVVSNLVQLEELTITSSFKKWERKGNEEQRKNAALGELELLKIEIDDPTLIAEEICLSSKIVKYQITVGGAMTYGFPHENWMHLDFNGDEITIGGWIKAFLRSTEYLCAEGDASINLDLEQAPNIKSLTYKRCSLTMNKLVVFGSLNNIHISEYDNISIWCHQIPLAFFTQLGDLKITFCSNNKTLFSSSIAENLVNLKRLKVTHCEQMVKVVEDKEMLCEKNTRLLFPSLQKLKLADLASLQSFWKSRCDLQFPSLTSVKFNDCPSLEFLTSSGSVSTPNLKFIRIDFKEIDVGDDVDLNGVLQLQFQQKGQHDKESSRVDYTKRKLRTRLTVIDAFSRFISEFS